MPMGGWFRAGRAAATMALAIVALLAAPPLASPVGQIVVYGAGSGSHLKLTVTDRHIVMDGYMAPTGPGGCHFKRWRMVAVCPLEGVSSVVLNMGPSGDMVEVLDPLPIPLTAYLGAGSDKFIGNDEPDTCYSQAARRNRCVGGGGNDVCITGPRNSDCVGGRGNDFCRHETGSDGCWGGPGRDICVMGPGQDGCHGGPGNDRLYGGSSPDQLYGGRGFDFCDGGPGWGRSHACETGPRR